MGFFRSVSFVFTVALPGGGMQVIPNSMKREQNTSIMVRIVIASPYTTQKQASYLDTLYTPMYTQNI